jgi:Icc-related predicted phosphoesterase
MLIPRKFHTFTEEALYSSLEALKPILKKAREEGKTILGLSHYPLVCGYPTKGHCIPDERYGEVLPLYTNLKDFYTLILKYQVPLVLSGHVHTYERTFPFTSGYRSKQRD